MVNGLFLQGGGAKGAFQAGAIYALRESGLTFPIISGTSIGSINGYYLYMGQEEEMKRFYTEYHFTPTSQEQRITKVIPNNMLIERLKPLKKRTSDVMFFYVNYVHIEHGQMIEVRKNLAGKDRLSQLRTITASSLLPFSLPDGLSFVTTEEAALKYGDRVMGSYFAKDVLDGKYENCDLDGGILNNFFMQPFAKHKVDKLYLISLHNELPIPDYLHDIYTDEQLILIQRKKIYPSNASLNFTQPFLKNLFEEGYEAAKNILYAV